MELERLSIELTNRCEKRCAFCYNESAPDGGTTWTVDDVVRLAVDCAAHGTRAVSFGGGEPLDFQGVHDVLVALRGVVFRSLTTHGLGLDRELTRLIASGPDKVHVSIHQPGNASEVARVIRQVHDLAERGIRSGVNLLVRASALDAARAAADALHASGIANDRIVYLPMRGRDTPTPAELARAAGGPFQSMTCLSVCGPSPRFASISWDRTVAWCSYTTTRRALAAPTHAALIEAMTGLGLAFCGDGMRRLPLFEIGARA